MKHILIRGGRLYDPANGLEGAVRDLWIGDGRVVLPPEHPGSVEVVDACGLLIAPGAIEIHSHIAGPQLAWARRAGLRELERDEGLLPPPARLAEAYLQLGYTTLFDAAMPPLLSWYTHADLAHMGPADRGAYTLVGDHACALAACQSGNRLELRDTLAWLLEASGGYALKLVNPGVGLAWKSGRRLESLDDEVIPGALTQRAWMLALAETAYQMGLPHPIHLHAGRLGRPGSWRSLIETARALEGLPAHLCHIQFYAYADDRHNRLSSAAAQVVEALASLPNLTFDVGAVTFGPAEVITADLQAVDFLREALHQRTVRVALEGEGGFGLLPLAYSMRDASHAVQWAVGLELLLRFPDPSRLCLTCDYPNGGSFICYPWLLSLLMDREKRQRTLETVHPAAQERSDLRSLDREYSLGEVIRMTSAGPARALGLADRGHLGPGAVADVRCYRPQADWEALFSRPEWIMKNGRVVAQDGEVLARGGGSILAVRPGWDALIEPRLRRRLSEGSQLRGYGLVGDLEERQFEVIPCRSTA
jgi:formylmethanofuran dehydrogenase subunit A